MNTTAIWRKSLLRENATLYETIRNLNESATQITLETSVDGILVGTVTGGDVWRDLLRGRGSQKRALTSIINRGLWQHRKS